MRHTQTSRRRALWWATAVLLLAAWLRLGAFQEALVGADQSSILAAAADIAAFRDVPLVGIKSSIGVMQTAITPYIAAIPLLFIKRVIAVKWWFSVLDVLALAFLFRAVRRSFGLKAAVISSLLYATNPWVVEYVRWIWYQSLISTFAVTAFAALLLLFSGGLRDRGHTCVALTLVSSALMAMVHLAGVPWAALIVTLVVYLAWRGKLWRGLIAGSGVSALVVLPYTIYLVRTNFADLRAMISSTGAESSGLNWASYRLTNELLGGGQILGTPRSPLWAQSVWAPEWLYTLIPILSILCTLWMLVLLITRREKRTAQAFTLVWLLLAPTIFVPTGIHLQHFYLMFIFPAPMVIIGAVAGYGFKHLLGQAASRMLMLIAVLLAGWWAYLWTVRISLEQAGELRAPTRAWLMDRTVDEVAGYLAQDTSNQVIVLTPYEGGLSPFDWVRNFVNSDRVRVVSPGSGFIIPTSPTCYLLGPDTTGAMLDPVVDVVTENFAMRIPANPPWRVWCYDGTLYIPGAHARWQNGMALLDVQIDGDFKPEGSLDITYRWAYRKSARPPETYHIFNHLLFEGESAAQIDGSGVPAWYWREGDVLITRFTLMLPDDLPEGQFTLVTGFYTYPGLERILLESGDAYREVYTWTRGPRELQKITDPELDAY